MASFVYTPAKTALLSGTLDFTADDIRLLLVDSTTTADTEQDIQFVGGLATLGELSGTGYVRKALASEAVNEDAGNNRAEFDAVDVTWTGIDAGTAAAAVLYKHVTNDADSPLIAYIDTGGFPFVTNGGDFTIQWNAEGILQAT